MDKYVIKGGKPLYGEVEVSGAKNAAVAIIPAALMVNGTCRLENIPQISDADMLMTILEHLGAKIKLVNRNAVDIDCTDVRYTDAPYDLMRKIRASYYLIGAMLGRFGAAKTTMPGGCNFGVRPIDQHIKGMTALGADVDVSGGFVYAKAIDGKLHGTRIYLDKVSVGATMNAETFLTLATIKIICLGLIAFIFSTAGGVVFGQLMKVLSGGKINPIIGAAGVSAVPMAARVCQKVVSKEFPGQYVLMHAMGPNVAGVIGTAVAAGAMLTLLK